MFLISRKLGTVVLLNLVDLMGKFSTCSLAVPLWISISITSFGSYIQEVMNIPKNRWLSSFIFSATMLVYFLARGKEGSNILNGSPKRMLLLGLISLVLLGSLFQIKPSFEMFALIALLSLISFAYLCPIFKKTKLREIPSLKIFLIAFTWSCVLVLLPIQSVEKRYDFSCFILWMSCFFYVLGLTVPFDIRDLHRDASGLKTIAQILGVQRAKICSLVSLFFSWGFMCYTTASLDQIGVYTVSLMILGILVVNACPKRPKIYYCFFVEGCSVLPLLLTSFLKGALITL